MAEQAGDALSRLAQSAQKRSQGASAFEQVAMQQVSAGMAERRRARRTERDLQARVDTGPMDPDATFRWEQGGVPRNIFKNQREFQSWHGGNVQRSNAILDQAGSGGILWPAVAAAADTLLAGEADTFRDALDMSIWMKPGGDDDDSELSMLQRQMDLYERSGEKDSPDYRTLANQVALMQTDRSRASGDPSEYKSSASSPGSVRGLDRRAFGQFLTRFANKKEVKDFVSALVDNGEDAVPEHIQELLLGLGDRVSEAEGGDMGVAFTQLGQMTQDILGPTAGNPVTRGLGSQDAADETDRAAKAAALLKEVDKQLVGGGVPQILGVGATDAQRRALSRLARPR